MVTRGNPGVPTRRRRHAAGTGFILVMLALTGATPLAARDYNIGDRADEDILSPGPMVVVDAEATAALKEKEARRVPVIYRYYPHAIDEVETAFRSTFHQTRSNFLDAVNVQFHQRQLDTAQTDSTEFRTMVLGFQKDNVLFPVDAALGATWAGGGSDQQLESDLAARLRKTMRAYVRADVSPDDIWVGSTLRLVSLADNETTTARLAEERGANISKTNFVSLPRAKTEFQEAFPPDQVAVGKYLATFIKPNCLMEADLTRELRASRTENILAAEHYQAGQVIVKRGQLIDRKVKAALDQLQQKAAAPRPPIAVAAGPAPANADARLPWIIGISTAGFVVLLIIILVMARRRTTVSLLPVPFTADSIDVSAAPLDPAAASWQQRALVAEQRAQKAQTMVRAGLLAHLAQWLSDRMTQKLVSQRAQLMDAHQKAAIEMAELEARLARIQAPLKERLQAYERRIAELEKDLLAKGEENRALTQAKIQLIRKQLAIERERNRLEFN